MYSMTFVANHNNICTTMKAIFVLLGLSLCGQLSILYCWVWTLHILVIGARLSESHTSVTALWCVCIYLPYKWEIFEGSNFCGFRGWLANHEN